MRGFKAVLFGLLSILFIGGFASLYAAPVESNTKMRSVSGKIESIDVKLGLLKLDSDAGQDTKGISEYRINQDETRVTDPSDTKFLVIKDLRAGQHITIKLIDSTGETLARKIIADPAPEPALPETTSTTTVTTTSTTVTQQQ
jgi:hypothetical protein